MMGTVRKMATLLVFALAVTTISAGRGGMLPSPTSTATSTSSSTPRDSSISIGTMIGCRPEEIARDLIIYCREPLHMPMPIDQCCGSAVGVVARPACFCLVKKQPAFGMSPLFNVNNMEFLLSRCGASVLLKDILYSNNCEGTYHEKQPTKDCPSSPAPPVTCKQDRCFIIKVIAFVGWLLLAFLIGCMVLSIIWPPAQALRDIELACFGEGGLHERLLEEVDHIPQGNRRQLGRLSLAEPLHHMLPEGETQAQAQAHLRSQLGRLSLSEQEGNQETGEASHMHSPDASRELTNLQGPQAHLRSQPGRLSLAEQQGNHEGEASHMHNSDASRELTNLQGPQAHLRSQLGRLSLAEQEGNQETGEASHMHSPDASRELTNLQGPQARLRRLTLDEPNPHLLIERPLQNATEDHLMFHLERLCLVEEEENQEAGESSHSDANNELSNENVCLLGKRPRAKNSKYYGKDWNTTTKRAKKDRKE